MKTTHGETKILNSLVIPPRFERGTPRLGIWCSILLSYGTTDCTHTKAGARSQEVFRANAQAFRAEQRDGPTRGTVAVSNEEAPPRNPILPASPG